MVDDYKMHEVVISKVDITNSKELAGAKLIVKDSNNEVVETWISKEESHKISLKPGTYSLIEETAPDGYKVAENIKFEVTKEGNITINGVKLKDNVVVMKDEPKVITVTPGKDKPNKPSNGNNKPKDKAVDTSDSFESLGYVALIGFALVSVVYMEKKKQKNNI